MGAPRGDRVPLARQDARRGRRRPSPITPSDAGDSGLDSGGAGRAYGAAAVGRCSARAVGGGAPGRIATSPIRSSASHGVGATWRECARRHSTGRDHRRRARPTWRCPRRPIGELRGRALVTRLASPGSGRRRRSRRSGATSGRQARGECREPERARPSAADRALRVARLALRQGRLGRAAPRRTTVVEVRRGLDTRRPCAYTNAHRSTR
jgi:hypothetical protein